MDSAPEHPNPSPEELRERVASLEQENARLRRRAQTTAFLPGLPSGSEPGFDPILFQKGLQRLMLLGWLPLMLIMTVGILPLTGWLHIPRFDVGPLVFFDPAGLYSGTPGIGRGIIAIGGLAIGVVAAGGGAVGVIACGGGAVGVVAIGGAAVGLVAMGGGAVGVIAIGGGATGVYALGGRGRGRHVFSLYRQDRLAVDFFTRYFPQLRKAFTNPLPVILVHRPGEVAPLGEDLLPRALGDERPNID